MRPRAAGIRVGVDDLGTAAWSEGDVEGARELLEQSLELFLELGDHAPAGGRLTYLGELALESGDPSAARAYYERSVEEYAIAGDESGVLGSTIEVAFIALAQGDVEAALRSYGAVLPRASEQYDLVYFLAGIGAAAAATGRSREAAR